MIKKIYEAGLIISGNQVAADVMAARILKKVYPFYKLGFTKDTFQHAQKLGLGVADPGGIILKEVEV